MRIPVYLVYAFQVLTTTHGSRSLGLMCKVCMSLSKPNTLSAGIVRRWLLLQLMQRLRAQISLASSPGLKESYVHVVVRRPWCAVGRKDRTMTWHTRGVAGVMWLTAGTAAHEDQIRFLNAYARACRHVWYFATVAPFWVAEPISGWTHGAFFDGSVKPVAVFAPGSARNDTATADETRSLIMLTS